MGDASRKLEFAVVPKKGARRKPYPCVVVDDEGRVREANTQEREYLETPFHPADGSRPYIKLWYYSKTPNGRLQGFCHRWTVPFWVKVLAKFSVEPIGIVPGSECKRDGCFEPCVKLSLLCELHHQEMIDRTRDPLGR